MKYFSNHHLRYTDTPELELGQLYKITDRRYTLFHNLDLDVHSDLPQGQEFMVLCELHNNHEVNLAESRFCFIKVIVVGSDAVGWLAFPAYAAKRMKKRVL